jgi:glycosyltransferase involved in cell wall biosynthesis
MSSQGPQRSWSFDRDTVSELCNSTEANGTPTAMKPLVSILIPAYNAEEWISQTLESAIAQTWSHKEIIVVDDGSKDQTLAVARRFESDQVRVVTQKNQGAAATRNNAFSLCHGDYIQYLDADDLLGPDKIAAQMNALGLSPNKRTLLSGSWGKFLCRYYRAQFIPSALWTDLSPVEWLQRRMGQNLYMQTASWLTSRELILAAGPWDTRLMGDDDCEFFCRVLLASDGVRFVPGSRIYYRYSGSSSLSYIGRSDEKRAAQMCSMQLHIKYLLSLEDSGRTRTACVQYLQSRLILFYPERMDLVEQARLMAKDLGGQLEPPYLPWKYSWIRAAFGWYVARQVQTMLGKWKWSLVRRWDNLLFRIENRKLADGLGR